MELGKIIKTFKSKKGNDVVFRYPKVQDFEAVWGFACDLAAEDTFVEQLSGKPPSRQEEERWHNKLLEQVGKGERVHVVVEVGGKYAGNGELRIGKYRHKHVAEVGLSLAAPHRGEGIGTELLKTLIDEARLLGLRLLTLSCFENNPRALHMYEKLGFKRAGIVPGAIAYHGGFVGEVKLYLSLV